MIAATAAPGPPVAPAPAAFVASENGPPHPSLVLRSATSGAVERRLRRFGPTFDGAGLAYSAALGAVYYTNEARPSRTPAGSRLRDDVMRLDVATGARRTVAVGFEPAVSPNGGELAYGRPDEGLSVRDLATGATRSIPLYEQLGAGANLDAATFTWLAGGEEIAVVPPAQLTAVFSGLPALGPARGCHPRHRLVIVFVHVPPSPAPLSARCVAVPGSDATSALAGPSPSGGDVVRLARSDGPTFDIEDVAADGTVTPVLGAVPGIPLAFDPEGDELLYQPQLRPPATLWRARLAGGRLLDRRKLIRDSEVTEAAW